jgi:hypothetical protein
MKTERRTCLGTGAMGIGADVRHASLRTRAGTLAGTTIPAPSTAAVMAAPNAGLDWLEFSRSEDAQQLSACACVSVRCDPEWCESPLCMGHSPSVQHAMRASGLGSHPAQTATFPAINARVSARTDTRWTSLSTCLGCSLGEAVSNEWNRQKSGRRAVVNSLRAPDLGTRARSGPGRLDVRGVVAARPRVQRTRSPGSPPWAGGARSRSSSNS